MNSIKNFALWFFSVIFLIGGLGNLAISLIYGLSVITIGLLMNPKFSEFLKSKNINLTTKQKWIIGIGLIIVGSIALPKNTKVIQQTPTPASISSNKPIPKISPTPTTIPTTNLYANDGRIIKDVPLNKISVYGTGWLTEEQKQIKDEQTKAEKQLKEAIRIKNEERGLEIVNYSITKNIIGSPEITIYTHKLTSKTIDAFDIEFYCFNNYNEPVSCNFISNKFNGTVQKIVPQNGEFTWNLCLASTMTKIDSLKITRVHFTDGTIWEE